LNVVVVTTTLVSTRAARWRRK